MHVNLLAIDWCKYLFAEYVLRSHALGIDCRSDMHHGFSMCRHLKAVVVLCLGQIGLRVGRQPTPLLSSCYHLPVISPLREQWKVRTPVPGMMPA